MDSRYNFTAQDVFTLPGHTERVHSAPNKILLSSLTHSRLDILDLCDRGRISNSLQTQGRIKDVSYCPVSNHIITIEDGTLYIYQSWWSDQKVSSIGKAQCMARCPISGKLAVYDGHDILIFDDLIITQKVNVSMEIVERLEICDETLLLQGPDVLVVFSLQKSKRYELRSNDEILWNFHRPDFILNSDRLNEDSLNYSFPKTGAIPDTLRDVYHPEKPIYGLDVQIKDVRSGEEEQGKILLFQRLSAIHTAIVPYSTCDDDSILNPLESPKKNVEFSSVLVATKRSCEILALVGSGDERTRVDFESNVLSVAVDDCFMHVLFSDCLLTYCIPLPGISKEWKFCLLRTHMMEMKQLLMTQDYLVVLSDREFGNMTVYSLLKPTTSEFFRDAQGGAIECEEAARDVVKLQIRTHGRACSERLLSLYEVLQTPESHKLITPGFEIDDVYLSSNLDKLIVSGKLTELGEYLLLRRSDILEKLAEHLSTQSLKNVMRTASIETASLLFDHLSDRIVSSKSNGESPWSDFRSGDFPDWFWELPPFHGNADSICEKNKSCSCSHCNSQLLRAASIVSCAKLAVRRELLLKSQANVPESLQLACILPFTESSSVRSSDYLDCADRIISLSSKHTMYTLTPHLLTVLCDVLQLSDFLKCIPPNDQSYLPWVENGLMRHRANKLRMEMISLGDELKPMMS